MAKAKFRLDGENATASAFAAALRGADDTARKMKTLFRTAFAGISVAAVAGIARQAIQTGDELNKAAIKAGVGGRAISELAYAAKLADVELDSLSNGLSKMQKALSEAATGAKAPKQTLDALGLSIGQIRNLRADKQFELIADRISKLKDPADRTR